MPELKDAPYFYDLNIEFRSDGKEIEQQVGKTAVKIKHQLLDESIWVAECRYQLQDALTNQAAAQKEKIHSALQNLLQKEQHDKNLLFEEYTIILLQHPMPQIVVNENVAQLGHLLRTLSKPLEQQDAAKILDTRVQFSQKDLTVVDWSGAIVVAEDADFQADIDLLKIGKYQLLRYRLLDQTLQGMLEQVRAHLAQKRSHRLPRRHQFLKSLIDQRLSLILKFEHIDQSLLLIGDWYSAELYTHLTEKLCLGEWKSLVRNKLDNLAEIDQVVRENLTFSWRRTLDLISVGGWLFLLIGYFVLFFLNN